MFSKGLLHGFGPKLAIFPSSFFLGNLGQENVFYDIPERKNTFLCYKNKDLKKAKNCNFSKGVSPWFWSKIGHFSKVVNPWFWSKNCHFSNLFFLGKIGQENILYDILERENAFLGYKNQKYKK